MDVSPLKRRATPPDARELTMRVIPLQSGDEMQPVSSSSSSLASSTNAMIWTRSKESYELETLPVHKRHPSIAYYDFYARTHSGGLRAAVAETVLVQQTQLETDNIFYGLTQLKAWMRTNVLQVINNPLDTRVRALLRTITPQTSAAFVSCDGSGLRNYVISVAKELRLDLYVVGHEQYDGHEMLPRLLKTAAAGGRTIVFFDRCDSWFDAHGGYLNRGISYFSALANEVRARAANNTASEAMDTLENSCTKMNAHELISNMWTIVSLGPTDIAPEFRNALRTAVYTVDPVHISELNAFVRLIVRHKLLDTHLVSIMTIDALMAKLEPLMQAYVDIGRADTPGFFVTIFDDAWTKSVTRAVAASPDPELNVEALMPTAAELVAARTVYVGGCEAGSFQAPLHMQGHATLADSVVASYNRAMHKT